MEFFFLFTARNNTFSSFNIIGKPIVKKVTLSSQNLSLLDFPAFRLIKFDRCYLSQLPRVIQEVDRNSFSSSVVFISLCIFYKAE